MRKIFALCTCVLLVALMVVPAFATGFSGTDDTKYSTPFQFKYIFVDGYSFPSDPFPASYVIPFENSSLAGGLADFSYNDNDVYGWSTIDSVDGSNYISSNYSFPCLSSDLMGSSSLITSPSFTLVSENFVYQWTRGAEPSFIIQYPISTMRVDNVVTQASYYVMLFDDSSDSYVCERRTFTHTEAYYPNDIIDLGYQFRLLAEASGGEIVCVDYLRITLNFRFVGTDTSPDFLFRVSAQSNPLPDTATWMRQYDLSATAGGGTTPPEEPSDALTWLADSVNAFLDVELFPGFSINSLFVLLLTVGLLLWFITLLI